MCIYIYMLVDYVTFSRNLKTQFPYLDPPWPFPFPLQATLTGNGFPWLYAQKEGVDGGFVVLEEGSIESPPAVQKMRGNLLGIDMNR